MKLHGIIPPIATPLLSDERVDAVGLRRLVRYLLNAGVHGFFVNGSMGGFALLTDDEQLRAIEIVVEEVGGKVPVIAGAADTSTRRVIEKARRIERLNPNCLVILPPYYYRLTQHNAISFFREVAQNISKPLFIYDNPLAIGFQLNLESIIHLSQESMIVGIKTSSQDVNFWAKLIAEFRHHQNFTILLGTEFLIPIGLMMGADGIVGGLHNIAPKIAVSTYEAVQRKDYEKAFELAHKLSKLWSIFEYGNIWGGFEAALQILGICDKVTASPYSSLSPSEKAKVKLILKEHLS
jgi:4-hydroxy-tetrahydrodipicolinate synthase